MPGVAYFASDNASTDGSGEALAAKGVEVLRQPVSLGRVGNWRACIAHFLNTDAIWLKWLFTGDSLDSSAVDRFHHHLLAHPNARLATSAYWVQEEKGRHASRAWEETVLVPPALAMKTASEKGNWFGPPSAVWLHREALTGGFDFGRLDFLADMQLFLDVAKVQPTLYIGEELATFDLRERRYHRDHSESQLARIEHAVMRYQAARNYFELSGDKLEYDRLSSLIERETEFAVLERAGFNSKSIEELEHILKLIPAKRMPAMALRRLLDRFRK
jgi:hypothetical protein